MLLFYVASQGIELLAGRGTLCTAVALVIRVLMFLVTPEIPFVFVFLVAPRFLAQEFQDLLVYVHMPDQLAFYLKTLVADLADMQLFYARSVGAMADVSRCGASSKSGIVGGQFNRLIGCEG